LHAAAPVYRAEVDDIVCAVVDAAGERATWAMTQYFAELDERFPRGFDPGGALAEAAVLMNPPNGVFLLAVRGDEVLGCGAVQWLDDVTAEIKRMWVSPTARGVGLGKRMLARLEDEARAAGRGRVVLDTNGVLLPAIAMYRGSGYADIDRYNDNPYAEHWFAKDLR
jgi:GNAT superfamily N-acetyltransferase